MRSLQTLFRHLAAACMCSTLILAGMNSLVLAQWIANGTLLSTAPGNQVNPRAVSDGSSGAIVVWAGDDIHAQRVGPSGVVMWPSDGVALCVADFSQRSPEAVSDGFGGVIAAWTDARSGHYDSTDVYVQRTDGSGNNLWPVEGVAACARPAVQDEPRLAGDGVGGAIVVWRDFRHGVVSVYAQRIDAFGSPVWTPNGIPIRAGATGASHPEIVADGVGGAVVLWADYRGAVPAIYGQRVDPSGDLLWQADGVLLSGAMGRPPGQSPALAIAGVTGGDVIAVWSDARVFGNRDIYAQRVDLAGNVLWATDGEPVCLASGDQVSPQVAPDGAGGAVISWQDQRGGPPDIYAQRIDAAGNGLWTPQGVAVCAATDAQYAPQIIADGHGGAVVTWYDRRSGTANYDIYAQQVSSSGTPACVTDGVAVCVAAGDQLLPSLVTGAGGAIIAWHDSRGSDVDAYASEFTLCENPVPVAFSRVEASEQDGAVIVSWATSHDEWFQGFRVYRSRSGDGFVRLADDLPVWTASYRDVAVTPDAVYHYQVAAVDGEGGEILSPVVTARVPGLSLALHMNHPNPFNPATTVSFTLPQETMVRLTVFNVAGAHVRTLYTGARGAGFHQLEWDGTDGNGMPVSSGAYFCRLEAGGSIVTRKMTLIR